MIKEEKFALSLSPAANIFCPHNTHETLFQKQKGHIQVDTTPAAGEANQMYPYELQQQRRSHFSLPKPGFSVATPKHATQHSSLTDALISFVNSENVAKPLVLISQQPPEYSTLLCKQNTNSGPRLRTCLVIPRPGLVP